MFSCSLFYQGQTTKIRDCPWKLELSGHPTLKNSLHRFVAHIFICRGRFKMPSNALNSWTGQMPPWGNSPRLHALWFSLGFCNLNQFSTVHHDVMQATLLSSESKHLASFLHQVFKRLEINHPHSFCIYKQVVGQVLQLQQQNPKILFEYSWETEYFGSLALQSVARVVFILACVAVQEEDGESQSL